MPGSERRDLELWLDASVECVDTKSDRLDAKFDTDVNSLPAVRLDASVDSLA